MNRKKYVIVSLVLIVLLYVVFTFISDNYSSNISKSEAVKIAKTKYLNLMKSEGIKEPEKKRFKITKKRISYKDTTAWEIEISYIEYLDDTVDSYYLDVGGSYVIDDNTGEVLFFDKFK